MLHQPQKQVKLVCVEPVNPEPPHKQSVIWQTLTEWDFHVKLLLCYNYSHLQDYCYRFQPPNIIILQEEYHLMTLISVEVFNLPESYYLMYL